MGISTLTVLIKRALHLGPDRFFFDAAVTLMWALAKLKPHIQSAAEAEAVLRRGRQAAGTAGPGTADLAQPGTSQNSNSNLSLKPRCVIWCGIFLSLWHSCRQPGPPIVFEFNFENKLP